MHAKKKALLAAGVLAGLAALTGCSMGMHRASTHKNVSKRRFTGSSSFR